MRRWKPGVALGRWSHPRASLWLAASLLSAPIVRLRAEEPTTKPDGRPDAKTDGKSDAKGQGEAHEANPVGTNTIERIIAIVNAEVILLSELRDRMAQLGQGVDETAGTMEQRQQAHAVMRKALDKMIEDTLILQQATELKLAVEEAEVDRAVEEVKRTNNLDTAQFTQALAEQGFTIGTFRRDMRRQILRLKTINTAVRSRLTLSEEDLRAFYEQTVRQSGGHREAHVRHILVGAPADVQKDAKALEARRRIAGKVVEEARGGAVWESLCKQYSDDTGTRDEGGDLGWVKEGEGLSASLSEVIFSMDQKGEVRGPIRTERGFEVMQLVERREGDVKPFEEVKENIRQQLSQQQIEKQTGTWVQELKKKAHIDVRL